MYIMDGVKFFLIMLYVLLGSVIFYILRNRDCKMSLYFLKVIIGIIFFEAFIIFSYEDVCVATTRLFCR